MSKSKDYKNFLRRCAYRRPEVREKVQGYNKKWRDKNPEKVKEGSRRYAETHKIEMKRYATNYNKKSCRDPVLGDVCSYNTLIHRKGYHPDLYEGVVPKDCIIRIPQIAGVDENGNTIYN